MGRPPDCGCHCCDPPVDLGCQDNAFISEPFDTLPSFDVVSLDGGAVSTVNISHSTQGGNAPGSFAIDLSVSSGATDKWVSGAVFFPNSPAVTVDPETAPPDGYGMQGLGASWQFKNFGIDGVDVYSTPEDEIVGDEPFVVCGAAFEQNGKIYLLPQFPTVVDRCWRNILGNLQTDGVAQTLDATANELVHTGDFQMSCLGADQITRIGWFVALTTDSTDDPTPRRLAGDFTLKLMYDSVCIWPLYFTSCPCEYGQYDTLNLDFKTQLLLATTGHSTASVVESLSVTLSKVLYTTPKDPDGVNRLIRFEGSATLTSGHGVNFVWYPCSALSVEFTGGTCPACDTPQGYELPAITPEDGSALSHSPPNVGFETTLLPSDCLSIFRDECNCGWLNLHSCGILPHPLHTSDYFQMWGHLTP